MEKFSKFLEDYSEWKAKNHPGKELDEYDMAFVRESYSKAVKAEEKALKEAKDLSDVEGSMTNVLSAHKNEINKLKTKAEIVDYVTNLFDKERSTQKLLTACLLHWLKLSLTRTQFSLCITLFLRVLATVLLKSLQKKQLKTRKKLL
jgi:hypothetical protein